MKIFFEDGRLNTEKLFFEPDHVIDAAEGATSNQLVLDVLHPDSTVYTNSIFAFSNRYAWNKELEVPEVYIRVGEDGCFVRIDHLTERQLREGHNLAKMYISGEFQLTVSDNRKQIVMNALKVESKDAEKIVKHLISHNCIHWIDDYAKDPANSPLVDIHYEKTFEDMINWQYEASKPFDMIGFSNNINSYPCMLELENRIIFWYELI